MLLLVVVCNNLYIDTHTFAYIKYCILGQGEKNSFVDVRHMLTSSGRSRKFESVLIGLRCFY